MLITVVPRTSPHGYRWLAETSGLQIIAEPTEVMRLYRGEDKFLFPGCEAIHSGVHECPPDETLTGLFTPIEQAATRFTITSTVENTTQCWVQDKDTYVGMHGLFYTAQRWQVFARTLGEWLQTNAVPLGVAGLPIGKAVAELSAAAAPSGGQVVIHGPQGWLEAAGLSQIGTVAGQSAQSLFVADPGFPKHGPTGQITLYATVGLAGGFTDPVGAETLDSTNLVRHNLTGFGVLGVGCAWSITAEWCP